jgi:hypothetical protein
MGTEGDYIKTAQKTLLNGRLRDFHAQQGAGNKTELPGRAIQR